MRNTIQAYTNCDVKNTYQCTEFTILNELPKEVYLDKDILSIESVGLNYELGDDEGVGYDYYRVTTGENYYMLPYKVEEKGVHYVCVKRNDDTGTVLEG